MEAEMGGEIEVGSHILEHTIRKRNFKNNTDKTCGWSPSDENFIDNYIYGPPNPTSSTLTSGGVV